MIELGRIYYNAMRRDLIWSLIRRDGLICSTRYGYGCGRKYAIHELTIDHVIPLSKGGYKTLIENLQLLCPPCHYLKSKKESGCPSWTITLMNIQSTGHNPKHSNLFVPKLVKLIQQSKEHVYNKRLS